MTEEHLTQAGWRKTSSGRWTHPTALPSTGGRALPVSFKQAQQLQATAERSEAAKNAPPISDADRFRNRLALGMVLAEMVRKDIVRELTGGGRG